MVLPLTVCLLNTLIKRVISFIKTVFMKILLISMTILFSIYSNAQSNDLVKAEGEARENQKLILLSFSGSDWCIPCIRLEKEIFENDEFKNYAAQHLILMRADFPRLKKHQLPKIEKKKNDVLAEKYNKQGAFPYTVLLDSNGKVLKQWDGIPASAANEFIKQLHSLADAAYRSN